MKQGSIKKRLFIIFALIVLLMTCTQGIIAYTGLTHAHNKAIDTLEASFDATIKTSVDNVIGALQANYMRYQRGEVTEEAAYNTAVNLIKNTRYDDGKGYFWVDLADGTCAVHINPEYEGKKRWEEKDMEGNYFIQNLIHAGDLPDGGFTEFYFSKPDKEGSFKKRGYTRKFEPYGWYISTGNYFEDVEVEIAKYTKEKYTSLFYMVVCNLLLLALGNVVVITYIRKVFKPIDKIVDATNSIKAGELDISLNIDSQDEIGILAGNFTKMTDNLKAIIEDISYCLGSMGNGNFRIVSNCREKYVGDFQDILLSMKKIKADMTSTLSELNMAANQVNAGSEQISTAAQGLSEGAAEQAASIEELSATIGEISGKIRQNAEDAQVAMQAVEDAGSGVVKSNEHMQELAAAMEEISNTSNQIGSIIKTIDDIAFQTNILALNAAVEAARAGTAGKGFAVVADEVRNLAGKSAEASKDISTLIENTIGAIEKSVAMTHEAANSLSTVVGKADLVTERVAQITNASREQADSAATITAGIDQISAVIQTNSATAEETAASSEELAGQANMLNSLVSRFEFDAE